MIYSRNIHLTRCRANGFTLIELLTVIAIIAVLAAILFPVFARVKAAAWDASALSNGKQLGLATSLYVADYDQTYPQATDGTPGENQLAGWVFYKVFGYSGAGTFDVTEGSLFPYVRSPRVFASQADPDSEKSGNSFALNGFLTLWTGTGLNPSKTENSIEFVATTMLLGEEGSGEPAQDRYGYMHGTNDGYLNPSTDHFAKFHTGGTVITYCDGHARIVHAEEEFVQTVCGSSEVCYQ